MNEGDTRSTEALKLLANWNAQNAVVSSAHGTLKTFHKPTRLRGPTGGLDGWPNGLRRAENSSDLSKGSGGPPVSTERDKMDHDRDHGAGAGRV